MANTRLNLTGRDKVLANLQKEIRGIESRSKRGLVRAALLVKADAVVAAPIDTGNLRGSGYVVVTGTPVDQPSPNFSNKHGDAAQQAANSAAALMEAISRTGVFTKFGNLAEIGFSTDYAAAVHERHPTKDKFLENALKFNAAKILQIIKNDARIK